MLSATSWMLLLLLLASLFASAPVSALSSDNSWSASVSYIAVPPSYAGAYSWSSDNPATYSLFQFWANWACQPLSVQVTLADGATISPPLDADGNMQLIVPAAGSGGYTRFTTTAADGVTTSEWEWPSYTLPSTTTFVSHDGSAVTPGQSCVVGMPSVVSVDDPAWFWSPYNW